MTKNKDALTGVKNTSRTGGRNRRPRIVSAAALIVCVLALALMWERVASAYLHFGDLNPNFEASAKGDAVLEDNDMNRNQGTKQQSRGHILEFADLGDQGGFAGRGAASDDVLNFFVTEYRINDNDQWEGFLSRYQTVKDKESGEITTQRFWELGGSGDWEKYNAGKRKLFYWDGSAFSDVAYTGEAAGNNATSNHFTKTRHPIIAPTADVNDLNFTGVSAKEVHSTTVTTLGKTGLTWRNGGIQEVTSQILKIDWIMDATNVGKDKTYFNMMHPSRAFVDWYHGYDVSYVSLDHGVKHEVRERAFLADPGNSGMLMVGPIQLPSDDDKPLAEAGNPSQSAPPAQDNTGPLAGYMEFAEGRQNIPPKLYFQTNDGLLHIVDPKSASEDMAILPPPSLLPHRAWSLKTFRDEAMNPGDILTLERGFQISYAQSTNQHNNNPDSPNQKYITITPEMLRGLRTLEDVVRYLNTLNQRFNDWSSLPTESIIFAVKDLPDGNSYIYAYSRREWNFYILYDDSVLGAGAKDLFGIFEVGTPNAQGNAWIVPPHRSVVRNPGNQYKGKPYLKIPAYSFDEVGNPTHPTESKEPGFSSALLLKSPHSDIYRWIDPNVVDKEANAKINSRPMFTLDGPLQLRYFNFGTSAAPDWTAFMLGTLGRGGGGLYAMDVTDPSEPQFKWYVETLEGVDHDPNKVRVLYQTSEMSEPADPIDVNLDGSVPDGYGRYRQLGFNTPKPGFGVARRSGGVYENIIAVPGGMQNVVNRNENGKMGAALYLIDPEQPESPTVLSSSSVTNGLGSGASGPDPHMGMMISPPTFLSRTTGDEYLSDGILAADDRGNIHHVNLNNGREAATVRTLGTLRLTTDRGHIDSYSNPHGLCAGLGKMKDLWIGGGTADIGGWKNPISGEKQEYSQLVIPNKEQMLFGFQYTSGTSRRDNWTGYDTNGMPLDNGTYGTGGWYVKLDPADREYGAEYATVRPFIFRGVMYAATFRQRLAPGAGKDFDGESRLYALDIEDGRPIRWAVDGMNGMYVSFPGVKINGFTVSNVGSIETLVISYTGDKNVAGSANQDDLMDIGGGLGDQNMQMALRFAGDDFFDEEGNDIFVSPVQNNDTVIKYWRYVED